jgi:hypothetical protein
MIFITFDPYNDYQFTYNYNSKDSSSNLLIKKTDDSIESSKFIENECFICMEDTKNIKLIKLNKQLFYWKNCQCDGDLHKECLEKWATLYNNCPICRINMIKNNNLIIKYINSNGYFLNSTKYLGFNEIEVIITENNRTITIKEINSILGQSQLTNILATLTYISDENKYEKIEHIKRSHINKCIKWCKKNNMIINDKYY